STSSSTAVKPTANAATAADPTSSATPATSYAGNRRASTHPLVLICSRAHAITRPTTATSHTLAHSRRARRSCRATQIATAASSTSNTRVPALTGPKPGVPDPYDWPMFEIQPGTANLRVGPGVD